MRPYRPKAMHYWVPYDFTRHMDERCTKCGLLRRRPLRGPDQLLNPDGRVSPAPIPRCRFGSADQVRRNAEAAMLRRRQLVEGERASARRTLPSPAPLPTLPSWMPSAAAGGPVFGVVVGRA